MSSVSGLTTEQRAVARHMTVQAAFLGLRNRDEVHYTQDSRRWQGIAQHLKAWRGQYPHYADCSSFATWCLWNGLDHYHLHDLVNGEHWAAGYTGTMLRGGKQVRDARNILGGDCVIYGSGYPGEHTAVCVGGGKVISNGSEPGPFLLPIRYRPDVLEIRRYI